MKTIQVLERYVRGWVVSQHIGQDGQPISHSLEVGDDWVEERKIDYIVYEYANDSGVPTATKCFDTLEKIKENYADTEWVWE